jgi:hypothetical protein
MSHSHFCEQCADVWIIECDCDDPDDLYQPCDEHFVDAEFEADPEFLAKIQRMMDSKQQDDHRNKP